MAVIRSHKSDEREKITSETPQNERALWAAELALEQEVLATALSFSIISITDSLQELVTIFQIPSTSQPLPQYLSACDGLIPRVILDRIANAASAEIITPSEAEDVACSLVLEERLRPQPWRESREPEYAEVDRAVQSAKTLLATLRAVRQRIRDRER